MIILYFIECNEYSHFPSCRLVHTIFFHVLKSSTAIRDSHKNSQELVEAVYTLNILSVNFRNPCKCFLCYRRTQGMGSVSILRRAQFFQELEFFQCCLISKLLEEECTCRGWFRGPLSLKLAFSFP